uniref:Uncharacterized protein n=1 Tax=Corethron hystrix TaxID=216773 RepID=A0A6U5ES08_9STRA|mmetsp:Transcript_195/g.417  ORF Transcript_195/g.417 Transcript_195/m.417 type:complete len:333 (+) Transcript_195:950-1948(+)
MAFLNSFHRRKNHKWTNNPATHFVNNLSKYIRTKLEKSGYKNRLGRASTRPYDQLLLINNAYKQAIIAEFNINDTRGMILHKLKYMHDLSGSTSPSFVSAAENTISHYKFEKPKYKRKCWGCGSPDHIWVKSKHEKNIICPHKNDPHVQENAKKAFAEFNRKKNEKKERTKNEANRKRSWSKLALAKLISKPNNKKNLRALLSFTALPVDDEQKKIHILTIFTFQTTPGTKSLLPVPILNVLPYICMQLRTPGEFNPGLQCLINTGSSLCTAWVPMMLKICEAYPLLVGSITHAKDEFQKIKLSGIVTNSDKNDLNQVLSCNLHVLIELFTP